MAGLVFRWTLRDSGWADCVVGDEGGTVDLVASSLTAGPEYLLIALTDLARGARGARAEFEAQPTVYRWIFTARGEESSGEIDVRVVRLPSWEALEDTGATMWTTRTTVAELGEVVLAGFDAAHREYGPAYAERWGRPLPLDRLARLRAVLDPVERD